MAMEVRKMTNLESIMTLGAFNKMVERSMSSCQQQELLEVSYKAFSLRSFLNGWKLRNILNKVSQHQMDWAVILEMEPTILMEFMRNKKLWGYKLCITRREEKWRIYKEQFQDLKEEMKNYKNCWDRKAAGKSLNKIVINSEGVSLMTTSESSILIIIEVVQADTREGNTTHHSAEISQFQTEIFLKQLRGIQRPKPIILLIRVCFTRSKTVKTRSLIRPLRRE